MTIPNELRPMLAMILQALDRDAAEGKAARGEMAEELRALLTAQPQASAAQSAPAGEREACMPAPEILCGPSTHVTWTPDHTPKDQRRQVVLVDAEQFAAWQRTQSAGVPEKVAHSAQWPTTPGLSARPSEVQRLREALMWRQIESDPPAVGQCVVLSGPQGADQPGRYWRLTGIRREDGYYDSNGCGCNDATHWHELLASPGAMAALAASTGQEVES